MNAYDEATKFRTFDAEGIDAVRLKLDRNSFNPEWRAAAIKWIGREGKRQEHQTAAAQAEQARIALSTAKATWIGAGAAILAAVVSVAAAIVSWFGARH